VEGERGEPEDGEEGLHREGRKSRAARSGCEFLPKESRAFPRAIRSTLTLAQAGKPGELRSMKYVIFAVLVTFGAIGSRAGGPVLEHGLSIHFMPDLYDLHGGFVVIDPAEEHPCRTFHTAKELVAWILTQPKSDRLNIPRNGIWIYADDPDFYSPGAKAEFDSLLKLCSEKKIETTLGLTHWRPAMPELRQKP
jgi:hypothetical protein